MTGSGWQSLAPTWGPGVGTLGAVYNRAEVEKNPELKKLNQVPAKI